MSARSRVFRRKVADDQPPEEPETLGIPPSSILAARKVKEKEKKAGKKPSLLSFDEEESTSPVQAKQESRSKGKQKGKLRADLSGLKASEDTKPTTQRSAAGSLTYHHRHMIICRLPHNPSKM